MKVKIYGIKQGSPYIDRRWLVIMVEGGRLYDVLNSAGWMWDVLTEDGRRHGGVYGLDMWWAADGSCPNCQFRLSQAKASDVVSDLNEWFYKYCKRHLALGGLAEWAFDWCSNRPRELWVADGKVGLEVFTSHLFSVECDKEKCTAVFDNDVYTYRRHQNAWPKLSSYHASLLLIHQWISDLRQYLRYGFPCGSVVLREAGEEKVLQRVTREEL